MYLFVARRDYQPFSCIWLPEQTIHPLHNYQQTDKMLNRSNTVIY